MFLAGRMTAPRVASLTEALTTDWKILSWTEDEPFAGFAEQVQQADAIVAGRVHGAWPPVPNLKLYQIPFTGHDWIGPQDVPSGCVVCNTFEHEITIAEYVLGTMLQREIGIAAADQRFRSRGWDGRIAGTGENHGELFGKTIGIVGYGHIGVEVARRARAFGMRCIAVTRTARPAPEPLAWLDTLDALERLLGESDYVLISMPLADNTRGLIDTAQLAQMKPDGVIINVGRGRIIDEGALYTALAENRIGGAIIDVWYDYPGPDGVDRPPSQYPFQKLDNLIMTPHFSARSAAMRNRRWAFVAANLDRFARGELLQNICFKGAG